jgi:hypothetical protein
MAPKIKNTGGAQANLRSVQLGTFKILTHFNPTASQGYPVLIQDTEGVIWAGRQLVRAVLKRVVCGPLTQLNVTSKGNLHSTEFRFNLLTSGS